MNLGSFAATLTVDQLLDARLHAHTQHYQAFRKLIIFSCCASKKKNKNGSVQFGVNYRALNKITCKHAYPMPRIDNALDTLQGAKYSSSVGLLYG